MRRKSDNLGTIYKIENKINHKVYIGQTKLNVLDRWDEHRRINDNSVIAGKNCPIKLAFKKYGIENFTFSIIERCQIKDLNIREIYWIKYYDSYNNGYNATKGGQGSFGKRKLTEEQESKLIELYKQGKGPNYLGRLFNISHGAVSDILARNSIDKRHTKYYKFTEEQRKMFLQLMNDGVRLKDIAKKYHVSSSYLSTLKIRMAQTDSTSV